MLFSKQHFGFTLSVLKLILAYASTLEQLGEAAWDKWITEVTATYILQTNLHRTKDV